MGKNSESSTESKTSSKKKINGAKKGKSFERQIANELGHIFPDAQRLLEYQASGNTGTDLEHTDIFQFQCKRYANYAPIGKINEVRLTDAGNIPVLVTQGNRMECMAVLPFSKLVTLIEIAYGLAPRLIHPDMQSRSWQTKLLPHDDSFGTKYIDVPETHDLDLDSLI